MLNKGHDIRTVLGYPLDGLSAAQVAGTRKMLEGCAIAWHLHLLKLLQQDLAAWLACKHLFLTVLEGRRV